MLHAFNIELFLNFILRQSIIGVYVDLLEAHFESAKADCIHDQRKARWFYLPVCCPLFEACIPSVLETEKLRFVAEIFPEVETRRAVDAAEIE